MSFDEMHTAASDSTPQNVDIPNSWWGLLAWAVGKWGIGIVFAAFLIPVYQDLKASNQRLADIAQANVAVLNAMAQKIETSIQQVQRLDDSLRRLESTNRN